MHSCLNFLQNHYKILIFAASLLSVQLSGADPEFQDTGGGALTKLRQAEGGAKMFGVFRAKNHDFMQKNLIFSNFRGAGHPQPLDLPLALKSKTKDLVGGATCLPMGFCFSEIAL
jgi:hypothetical protein